MFDVSRTVGRWPSILASLGVPAATLSQRNCECPFCGGKDRFRFTDKDGAGIWICNKCGTHNGFHFVQRWENTDFKGACAAIDKVLPQSYATPIKVPEKPSVKLNALWSRALAVEPGDPVSNYLIERGLPEPDTSEIRYLPEMAYWHDGQLLGKYDAMLARVRDGTGAPMTLHVTYLKDGRKADVPAQKKVLSKMGDGSHVRLSAGHDNVLCLTEGIETGLAVRERTGKPTWAMLSAGGLLRFKCPDGVDTVEIWGDNDLGFAGQAHAYSLANKLSNNGINVTVWIPMYAGTDWADC